MMNPRRISTLLLSLLFLILSLSVTAQSQRLPVPVSPTLHARVVEYGSLYVIVKLDLPYRMESELTLREAKRQRIFLAETRRDLLSKLEGTGAELVPSSMNWVIPYMALSVDENGLSALGSLPGILEIVEDRPSFPSLIGSLGPTDTYEAHNLGVTGLDQTVAVLDSGINRSHPMLAEQVVGEICYSANDPSKSLTSLCADGANDQIGSGAATSSKCVGIQSCDHGTFMSGIVAGAPYTTGGQTYKGLGFGAKVFAAQVYAKSTSAATCGAKPAPCILTYTNRQTSALNYLYLNRATYNLAAVVLGFNGAILADVPGICSSDPRREMIDTLFSVGIATIVSSGNDSDPTKVAAPACVANAITVGATDDARNIASFSNSSNLVDLLAIGVDVQSAGTGISIFEDDGTSAAAAMVAGAWAILKQVRPNAEVLVILDALQTTGIGVLDGRNGLTHKFIQVGEAIKLLQSLPAATNLITNAGFEAGAGTIATGWTQNGVGATRVCGTGSPLVYAGTCAAQLVYTGQVALFKQVFVQGATNANYAWLSARINKHGATGTIQATLVGGDGSKLKLKLVISGTGTYRLVSNTVPLKNQTYTVTIKMKISGGSYEVDDLYLSLQDTTATIP